jgi:flagellar biosynthetic protein FliQ
LPGYYLRVELNALQTSSQCIELAIYLAAPVLAISLVVGFLVSIFQAVTSIQEQTLAFVPKILATGVALIFFGPWMMRMMNTFASGLFGNVHTLIR